MERKRPFTITKDKKDNSIYVYRGKENIYYYIIHFS